jgi:leucyl/phenylalanyl-tRNA--protein transferase
MFSRERDGSKAALDGLVRQCLADGTVVIDCQQPSAHLRSLGSRAIPRRDFVALLARAAGPENG